MNKSPNAIYVGDDVELGLRVGYELAKVCKVPSGEDDRWGIESLDGRTRWFVNRHAFKWPVKG
jgi:hypothetical protein